MFLVYFRDLMAVTQESRPLPRFNWTTQEIVGLLLARTGSNELTESIERFEGELWE